MTAFILDTRTATPHFPGIGRYVTNLAGELPNLLREEEQLLLLEQGAGGMTPPRDEMTGRLAAAASPFSLAQQWQIPALLRRQRQSKIQNPKIQNPQILYHSPYYLMPYRPGAPTVLTFYDIIPIAYPEYVAWRARWLFRAATRLACAAAQRIVAISAVAQGDLLAHFAVDPAKVTVTPLAPDARFRPQPRVEVERVRTKYNLPEPFFLYFGINKPHKNLTTLIDAYSQLQNAQSGLAAFPALVIAGAWDKRYPEAKEDAATLGLGDTVHFLGRIDDDDLPALYTAATVFVFPSRYEGFGLPVLEAMACGTPVACSNASSLPEVAGDAALLFAPTDTSAIAQAIQRLTDDASLRADLRQRGLRQAARFTWRRTAELTLAVYRDALHLD